MGSQLSPLDNIYCIPEMYIILTSINSYNKGGNFLSVASDKHKNVAGLNRVMESQLSPLDNSYFIPRMDII